jgi:long-chain acyl-CoA synthetase
VPMDRHGSLRESLRLAQEVIRQGWILLIFPEGTRSTNGIMVDFKPSIGYLALSNKVDVLPMYLDGTFGALPKGSMLPKHRQIAAHIGPLLRYDELRRATEGMPKSDAYREASRLVELAVRRLAPPGSINRGPAAVPSTAKLTAESVMAPEVEE